MARYLIINSVCGIRSTGRICTDIADTLIADGNDVRIAYGREEAPDKYKNISYKICGKFNNYLDYFKSYVFDNHGFNSKLVTKKFLKWAEEYNPDVVWLHNIHGYYINIDLLFNWLKSHPNIKVKWTLHDCWSFTGHCSYFSFNRCDGWKNGCKNCKFTSEYPKSISNNTARNWKKKKQLFTGLNNLTLITPSDWLARLTKESFLYSYNVEVVRNKINLEIFKKRVGY